MTSPFRLPAAAHPGTVHLQVSDLARSLSYYEGVLGLHPQRVTDDTATLGVRGAERSLVTLQTRPGVTPARRGAFGLYHFAINYPTRKDLAVAFKRLLDNGWQIDGYNDHGTHVALYLHDPDFNGIELAWDRDPSEWPQFQGVSNDEAVANAINAHRRLDVRGLLAEATADDTAEAMTPA